MLAMLLSGVGEIPPKTTQSPNVMGTFQTTFQKQNESVRSSRATVLVRFFFYQLDTSSVILEEGNTTEKMSHQISLWEHFLK